MGNDASKRKPGTHVEKEIAVLKANSNLSEQEIRQMYEEFNYEAESGTGRMNKRQFRKFHKQVAGSEEENATLADNAFAVFDTNHDGSIDFSEFVLATAMENKNDLDTALELSFAMIDTSGDERISYNEMVNFVEKASKLLVVSSEATHVDSKVVAADIYKQFDLDKGDKLTREQFIDGCKHNKSLAKMFALS